MGSFARMIKSGKGKKPLQQRLMNQFPGVDRVQATPRELGRIGNPALIENMHPNKICAVYRDISFFETPMAPGSSDDSIFTCRKLFGCGPDSMVDCNRITDLSCGAQFEIPFVLVGIAAVATGEPAGFTMAGVTTPALGGFQTGSAGCPTGPDEPTVAAFDTRACSAFCDAPDLCMTRALNPDFGDSINAAHLMFGKSTWIAIQKLVQITELQFILRQRFVLFNRAMSEMLQTDSFAFLGTGDARIAPVPFINYANSVSICNGINRQFFPVNLAMNAAGDSTFVPPSLPVQDIGGINWRGLGRFCPLAAPVLICPGIPVNFQLAPACDFDPDCLSVLREMLEFSSMTVSPTTGGGVAGIACSTSACPTTLAVHDTIPAGQIKFGIVLYGFELWDDCVLDFVLGYYPRRSVLAQTLMGVPYLYDQMRKAEGSGQSLDPVSKNRLHGILGTPPAGS